MIPARFRREGTDIEKQALADLSRPAKTTNSTLEFLAATAQNATESSDFVRQASASYRTPVDYGAGGGLSGNLQRVAALIAAKIPTRLFYVTYQGNSFDTHVQQADLHGRLLMYTADAVRGFIEDLKRIGRADEVAVMIFTEFGRRVEENGSLGTDHGTATPMFVIGKGVKGGFYGQHPSLTDLDDGNMKMTTDFRRVYATAIREWLGCDDTEIVLKGRFDSLGAVRLGPRHERGGNRPACFSRERRAGRVQRRPGRCDPGRPAPRSPCPTRRARNRRRSRHRRTPATATCTSTIRRAFRWRRASECRRRMRQCRSTGCSRSGSAPPASSS